MKQKYKDVCMETFIPKEEEELSKEEKHNIKQRFYESVQISKSRSEKRFYNYPKRCNCK